MKKISLSIILSFCICSPVLAASSATFNATTGTLTITDPNSNVKSLVLSCSDGSVNLVDDVTTEEPSNPGGGTPVLPGFPGLPFSQNIIDVSCGQVKVIVISLANNSADLQVDLNDVTKSVFPLLKRTKVILGSQNDLFYGSEVTDEVDARAGNDTIYGRLGDDKIKGSSGNDIIYGESGADTINGESGNDTIYGGPGKDKIFGGSGNDVIYGGGAKDTLSGGSGKNTVRQ